MGVDFNANFGIGYEIVCFPESWNGDENYDEWGFLDGILSDTKYSYIHWGDEGYSGDPDTYAIVFRDHIESWDLVKELDALGDFLRENNIILPLLD